MRHTVVGIDWEIAAAAGTGSASAVAIDSGTAAAAGTDSASAAAVVGTGSALAAESESALDSADYSAGIELNRLPYRNMGKLLPDNSNQRQYCCYIGDMQ